MNSLDTFQYPTVYYSDLRGEVKEIEAIRLILNQRPPRCVSNSLILKLVSGNLNPFLAQDLMNRLCALSGPIN